PEARRPGWWVVQTQPRFAATQRANAFDLVLFVPYVLRKAPALEARSTLHDRAAVNVACWRAAAAACAFCETQLPYASVFLAFRPYQSAKVLPPWLIEKVVSDCSARHACAALARSAWAARSSPETHLPNALRCCGPAPYRAAKSFAPTAVRCALHSRAAFGFTAADPPLPPARACAGSTSASAATAR